MLFRFRRWRQLQHFGCFGADAGVAAGPVGRNAAAATDGQLKAEIWSWSRARGLFAGVALACFGLYRLFKRSRWL